ncbi:hypothetical protein QP786_02885, partial [Gleimia europaea]|nr:hypothetical protein [Gleimia europaea]
AFLRTQELRVHPLAARLHETKTKSRVLLFPSILWDQTLSARWSANLEADPEDTQKFLNFLPDSTVIYRKSIFDTSVLGSIFTQRTVL